MNKFAISISIIWHSNDAYCIRYGAVIGFYIFLFITFVQITRQQFLRSLINRLSSFCFRIRGIFTSDRKWKKKLLQMFVVPLFFTRTLKYTYFQIGLVFNGSCNERAKRKSISNKVLLIYCMLFVWIKSSTRMFKWWVSLRSYVECWAD